MDMLQSQTALHEHRQSFILVEAAALRASLADRASEVTTICKFHDDVKL